MFVGQGPGKNHPPGSRPLEGKKGAGARLAKLCGLTNEELLKRCDTSNLLPDWRGKNGKGDNFPMNEAIISAELIWTKFFDYDRVVLFGSNVASAFGMKNEKVLKWVVLEGTTVAVVPHPSGINRWYNDPENRKKAEKFLRKLIKDYALQV